MSHNLTQFGNQILFSLDKLINEKCISSLSCTISNLRYLGRVDEADQAEWGMLPFSSPPDPRDGQ